MSKGISGGSCKLFGGQAAALFLAFSTETAGSSGCESQPVRGLLNNLCRWDIRGMVVVLMSRTRYCLVSGNNINKGLLCDESST